MGEGVPARKPVVAATGSTSRPTPARRGSTSGSPDSSQIGRIRIHPTNPDVVYVAAIGHPYGPNAERGVFRTKDGGTTWQKVLFVNDRDRRRGHRDGPVQPASAVRDHLAGAAHAVGHHEHGPGRRPLQVHRWRRHVEPAHRRPAGVRTSARSASTVSPVNPQRVWATVEADDKGGVYRSDDGGSTWQLLNDGFNMTSRPVLLRPHLRRPARRQHGVHVLREVLLQVHRRRQDLHRSADAAQRLPRPVDRPEGFTPRWSNGNDGGAAITFNGGRSWSSLDNQPTAQFYAVITDNGTPYRIYGSQQDNTTVSIASRTNGAGITETDWHPVGGGESGYLAPTPSNPPVVYGGSYFGLMTRYDERTGESRNVTIWPDYNGGRTAAEIEVPLPVDVSRSSCRLTTAPRSTPPRRCVFRSANGGQSWEAISPDLTRNDKAKQNGGRLEEYYSTIFTLAESPREKGVHLGGIRRRPRAASRATAGATGRT